MANFQDDRILRGDISIFSIATAMSPHDRAAFLDIQNIVGSLYPGYSYLEVGSDRGGSLIAPLIDSRCGAAISIDLRPASQPDERGKAYDYPVNGTALMLEALAVSGVPEQAFARLRTFDADIGQLPLWRVGTRARFAFIDAEHTNQAVFRDWLNVCRFLERDAVVAFHDANLVFDALENIQAILRHQAARFVGYYLPDVMFVLGLGAMGPEVRRVFAARALDPGAFIARSRDFLHSQIAANVASRP